MISFRAADLDALLTALRAEGCAVIDKTESSEQGKLGWVIVPDGNDRASGACGRPLSMESSMLPTHKLREQAVRHLHDAAAAERLLGDDLPVKVLWHDCENSFSALETSCTRPRYLAS